MESGSRGPVALDSAIFINIFATFLSSGRINNATGHVVYCRTHEWNTAAVRGGNGELTRRIAACHSTHDTVRRHRSRLSEDLRRGAAARRGVVLAPRPPGRPHRPLRARPGMRRRHGDAPAP